MSPGQAREFIFNNAQEHLLDFWKGEIDMARKHTVGDNEILLIATYLTNPEVGTEIHAEIPAKYRDDFEAECRRE